MKYTKLNYLILENLDKQKILYVILQLEEQLIICLLNYY